MATLRQILKTGKLIIGQADYDALKDSDISWYIYNNYNNTGSATVRGSSDRHDGPTNLHNFLFDLHYDEVVVHLNRNGMDYRRSNLLVLTQRIHSHLNKVVGDAY